MDDHLSMLTRVDRLLRRATTAEGADAMATSTKELLAIAIAGATIYGAAMGLYALCARGAPGLLQMLAATAKVPLLFALTIAVTFPSFYVLTAVGGIPASARELLRMQMLGTALATTLLASLGPITAFFTISTDSHAFMVVLSAVFFAVAGAVGLRLVWRRGRMLLHEAGGELRAPTARWLLRGWLLIAVIVAAQSAWILRPLIGEPQHGFVLLEPRSANAFTGFFEILRTPQ